MARFKKAEIVEMEKGLLEFHVNGGGVFGIDATALDTQIREKALIHGLKQKIADSYAGFTTVAEIEAAIDGVITGLVHGMWNTGRSVNGGIWVEALARAAGVELDEARIKWGEMDDDLKKDVKKNPAVKTAKAEIELERAREKAQGTVFSLGDLG